MSSFTKAVAYMVTTYLVGFEQQKDLEPVDYTQHAPPFFGGNRIDLSGILTADR
jgi:hypothetical protein